jgi:hypothetical protein
MSSMTVFITVPHADCRGDAYWHHCDLLAEEMARKISDAFLARNVETKLFVGNVPRRKVDLNRPVSRLTRFRRSLSKELKNAGFNDVLLDIHSYPSNSKAYELYILDIKQLSFDDTFNTFLIGNLESQGIKTFLLNKGSLKNDIVVEAMTKHGIHDSSLIEVSENLIGQKDRLLYIADAIADATTIYREQNFWEDDFT